MLFFHSWSVVLYPVKQLYKNSFELCSNLSKHCLEIVTQVHYHNLGTYLADNFFMSKYCCKTLNTHSFEIFFLLNYFMHFHTAVFSYNIMDLVAHFFSFDLNWTSRILCIIYLHIFAFVMVIWPQQNL